MNDNCDAIRSGLVELLYDEADPGTERRVRAHLDSCPGCRERLAAFRRVRADLDEWETADVPPRIAFVGLPPWRRDAATSPWTRRLMVAASFVLGIVLTGALVNLEVERSADGWTARTGLWPRGAVGGAASPGPGAARTDGRQSPGTGAVAGEAARPASGGVRFITSGGREILPESELERLIEGGRLEPLAGSPGAASELTRSERAEIRDLLARALADRDARLREDLREIVAASELRQQQNTGAALATVYDLLRAQHEEDLVALTGQLGIVEADTDDQLQRTHAAIDYLLRQVSERDDGGDPRERR